MSRHTYEPEPTLRASDFEREQTVSALRAHHAAGRLQTHEFDERITKALTATTVAELSAQLRDLPRSRADRGERRQRARRLPLTMLALTVAATAIVLTAAAHLIWILPLLWLAGPWHRHRPVHLPDARRGLRLPPTRSVGSRP